MSEIKEAKSLRWLAFQFPKVENPKDDIERMQNCINLYCTAAAEKIEQLTEENERLRENCKPPIARNIDILKATTKADTAREIFEEIDKLLDEHMVKLTYIDGTCTLVFKRTLEIGIAELKKKYTEGV